MHVNGFDKSREIRAFMFSHGTDEQHAAVATAKLVSTVLQRQASDWTVTPGLSEPSSVAVVLNVCLKRHTIAICLPGVSSGKMAFGEGS